MAEKIRDAKDKLGEEKYNEVLEKDWKVVDPPSEEELAQEKPKHPKARNNPNSRKNLAQYNKRSKEQKEKSISNLKYVEKEPDVDPKEFLGDHPKLDYILGYLPFSKVFPEREEQEEYFRYISYIISDFDPTDLTASDIEDIVTLGKNAIFENRLLKESARDPVRLLDCAATIEKYRKSTEKIKATLLSRRSDRVDPRKRTGLSIVELADYLDAEKESDFNKRMAKLEEERQKYKPANRDQHGKLISND